MAGVIDTTDLPDLRDTAAVAAGTAAAMSEVALSTYDSAALAEFDGADRRYGLGDLHDTGKFVRQVAESYLLGAGDFVCGLQYVTVPEPNLNLSSSSLARSACEYANKATWISEGGVAIKQRICRGVAIVKESLREEAWLLDPFMDAFNRWHAAATSGSH